MYAEFSRMYAECSRMSAECSRMFKNDPIFNPYGSDKIFKVDRLTFENSYKGNVVNAHTMKSQFYRQIDPLNI